MIALDADSSLRGERGWITRQQFRDTIIKERAKHYKLKGAVAETQAAGMTASGGKRFYNRNDRKISLNIAII